MEIRQTSFLKKALTEGESVCVEARVHAIRYIHVWISMLVACVFLVCSVISYLFICVSIFSMLWAYAEWLSVSCIQMVVTNKRVICKTGILSINTEELKNNKVESIEIKQSVLGRLLGYATITFSGTGTSDVCFADVADPWEVKKAVDMAVSAARQV